nr:probable pre-mRNA-splicing factor ATP-dependent RNA helicase DEAH4 [Tanacetum cinerariifolium]
MSQKGYFNIYDWAAGSVLYLKSLDLPDIDILKFDFLDAPSPLEEKLKEVAVEQDEMKKYMRLMMKEIQRLSKLVPDKSDKSG